MVSLGSISPSERAAAFESMQGLIGEAAKMVGSTVKRTQQSTSPAAELLASHPPANLDSLEWSPAVGLPKTADHFASSAPYTAETTQPKVQFTSGSWSAIPVETLSAILGNERPIVIATVLNQLPSERAMAVLKMLPMALAGSALATVPNLHLTDRAILQDIEQELHRKIGSTEPNAVENQLGLAKLHSILSSLPEPERSQWQSAVAKSNPVLGSRMGWANTIPFAIPLQSPRSTPIIASCSRTSNPQSASEDLFEDRMTIPIHEHLQSAAGTESKDSKSHTFNQTAAPESFGRPDLQPLSRLSDRDFVQVIHACSPQTVLLAISGASREFVSRVERLMPSKDIPRLRARLSSLGPISLRDVDAAQASILATAQTLSSQGKIASLETASFTAAA